MLWYELVGLVLFSNNGFKNKNFEELKKLVTFINNCDDYSLVSL